jgi:hypothetical protein
LSQPLKYAVISAVTAIAATTAAIAVALAQEEPGAAALGFSFGISLAPHSALIAMPLGVIFGTLRPRMNRWTFTLAATLCAGLSGWLLGWWVVGDGHYFPGSVARFICIAWTLAAFAVAIFSEAIPETAEQDD